MTCIFFAPVTSYKPHNWSQRFCVLSCAYFEYFQTKYLDLYLPICCKTAVFLIWNLVIHLKLQDNLFHKKDFPTCNMHNGNYSFFFNSVWVCSLVNFGWMSGRQLKKHHVSSSHVRACLSVNGCLCFKLPVIGSCMTYFHWQWSNTCTLFKSKKQVIKVRLFIYTFKSPWSWKSRARDKAGKLGPSCA